MRGYGRMGLQGDKATHDFLSLYSAAAANDSALPAPLLQESKNAAPPSQGFLLKTHDFLQPRGSPSSSPPSRQQPAAVKPLNTRRAVPAGVVGTFSIINRPAPAAELPGGAVKQEEPAFALWGQPDPRAHPWPQPQPQMPPERKVCGGGFTDAVSRSSGGDDDGHAARREVSSSSLKEIRVETKGGGSCSGSAGTDQLPNSPRSKHSATEQRRRSKINDRFQVLREILPQNDQKRDKASFLLEVIEYIRFLQERAQKYEASHQEWNQENSKVMPWSNIYFRSFWKNEQNKDEINGDTTSDPSQVIRNGSPLGFPFALKPGDGNNAAAFETASGGQELAGANQNHLVSFNEADTPGNVPNNVASQKPAQLTESLPSEDREVNDGLLKDPELAIDEGTISVSSQYSQGLLATLNHALQNSGIDLSEASISVQINLGKRAIKGPSPGANCSSKEELTDQASRNQAIWHERESGDGALEHPQATKRRKSDR